MTTKEENTFLGKDTEAAHALMNEILVAAQATNRKLTSLRLAEYSAENHKAITREERRMRMLRDLSVGCTAVIDFHSGKKLHHVIQGSIARFSSTQEAIEAMREMISPPVWLTGNMDNPLANFIIAFGGVERAASRAVKSSFEKPLHSPSTI